MQSFTLNGKAVCTETTDKNLLYFLREDMGITSVKDGCNAGACGSCTVIADGKAVRACLTKMSGIEGRNIVTVEGLTPREQEVFAHAFAFTGGVQCGFCIPGMVLAAKVLLDINAEPTSGDIKRALRGNICRCTGYVKIEEAVAIAAKLLREGTPIPSVRYTGAVGEDFPRLDAHEKVLGTGLYSDDLHFPGMVYGKALRLPYPRAFVRKIDFEAAKEHPDFVAVLTAKDIPGAKKIGHLRHIQDWDVLIAEGEETRYVGDGVALVAARTWQALDEVAALVKVEYDELPVLHSPDLALAADAPKLHEGGNVLAHEKLVRGDADGAIAAAAHVVTNVYTTPFTEHAFMEPECAVAMPDGDGGIHLYSGGQGVYDEQREVSSMLGVAPEKVRVTAMLVGGAFGGKEDMSVQHHAAMLAWHLRCPVKVRLTRQESLMVHPKRHAMRIEMTSACDKDGNMLAVKAKIVSDTGAYASLGGPVLQRACTHAAGPYSFKNLDVEGTAVYTNNPPAGAFRGFGVTQVTFASESNLNWLAEKVGLSPWEMRFRNAIRPGQVLPNGQLADDSTAMVECLLALKQICADNPRAGIAAAFKNSGLGVGVPDAGRCRMSVEGGKVRVLSGASCIGQGMTTIIMQMACQTLKLPPEMLVVEKPDTARTPNSGTTTASRQTVFTGEAVRLAAVKLKAAMDEAGSLDALEGQSYDAEYFPHTDKMGSDVPFPVSHVAYGYGAQVVLLDDAGMVEKVVAAYDVGTPINRRNVEGQIEGGVTMGLGYALTEDFIVEQGMVRSKYGTLGLFRSTDTPPIETILVDKEGRAATAYGAKGVGELATIPTAPAVSLAYYHRDGKFRTKLPLGDTSYSK
ncbi:MAG: selenium-dependent xanthine dehydrogenase [Defluviitaleaceae bacterium]|nr:selenium-dependent xanthine dehydrogenase [Defluviitaleaceae bacterium]